MQKPLAGRKVAILIGNGFDEIQMTDCQRALLGAGAIVKIISTSTGLVNGWQGKGWGHYYPIDQQVGETLAADFDMLLLPGGERGVDRLLETAHTTRIVRGFRDAGKPVAAIGSGVVLLAAADRLAAVDVSAHEDHREKIAAVGGRIAEGASTIDGGLLTARDDAELAVFVQEMLNFFTTAQDMKSAA